MDKQSVEVIAHCNLNGEVVPLKIKIGDSAYKVDKVGKPVKGASFKSGIQGNRYSCLIDGKRAYLYLECDNKWYVKPI